jgi:hypothetical protein
MAFHKVDGVFEESGGGFLSIYITVGHPVQRVEEKGVCIR